MVAQGFSDTESNGSWDRLPDFGDEDDQVPDFVSDRDDDDDVQILSVTRAGQEVTVTPEEKARFVQRYNLNEDSEATLRDLADEHSRQILDTWKPRGRAPYDYEFKKFAKVLIIKGFCASRGLNFTCRRFLEDNCDESTAFKIITNYEPRGNPAKAIDLFMSYAKMTLKREQGKPFKAERKAVDSSLTMDESAFVRQWNLDSESVEMLQSMKESQRKLCMREFAPPSGVDSNKKFQAFCRSRGGYLGGKNTATASRSSIAYPDNSLNALPESKIISAPTKQDRPTVGRSSNDYSAYGYEFHNRHLSDGDWNKKIDDFCRKWKLSSASKNMLEELPKGCRHQILCEFLPRTPKWGGAADANVDHLFQCFCKSRSSMKGYERQFQERFKLDNRSIDLFWSPSFTEKMRTEIMESFCPKEGMEDCNAMFTSFAKSVMKKHGSGYSAFPSSDWKAEKASEFGSSTQPATLKPVAARPPMLKPKAEPTVGPIAELSLLRREFCSVWKLPDHCDRKLSTWTGAVQRKIMQSFAPPSEVKEENMASCFLSYLTRFGRKFEKEAARDLAVDPKPGKGALASKRPLSAPAVSPMLKVDTSSISIKGKGKGKGVKGTSKGSKGAGKGIKGAKSKDSKETPYPTRKRSAPAGEREAGPTLKYRTAGSKGGDDYDDLRRSMREDLKEKTEQIELVTKFCKRNKLNPAAIRAIRDLSTSAQNKVIAHFDPTARGDPSEQFLDLVRKKIGGAMN